MKKMNPPTYLATLFAAALVLVLSLPMQAGALLVPMGLEDLARSADSVVVAQVTGAKSRAVVPADARQGIVTDNVLQVSRVIAGERPERFTLTQPGGQVGDLRLAVAEQAELTPGTRLVLFLDEHNRIVGAEQGALQVVAGSVEGLDITVTELARRVRAARGEAVLTEIAIAQPIEFSAAASVEGAAIEPLVLEAVSLTAASTPTVSSVTPSEQYAGVGRSITINGSGFGITTGKVYLPSGTSLSGALKECPVTSWTDTRIVATVPGKVASGKVVVQNSAGVRAPDFPYTLSFSADNTNGIKFGAPLVYRVNENTADMTGEANEAKKAFDVWNAAGSAFHVSYGGSTSVTTVARDNVNAIYFASTGTTSLATNYYWYDSKGTLFESDIVFNDDYKWGATAASNVWDLWTVLLHEVGHSAGLDDQYSNFDRVMGAAINSKNRRELSRFEVTGAIFVNGPDASTPTAPTVSSSTHPVDTTWYPVASATLQFSASAGTGIAGYSYSIDSASGTVPDSTVDTTAGSITVTPGEGERWFHVRAVSGAGVAGPAAHYRLRSDSQAPAGTVQIGDSAQYVRSTTVAVTANLTDTSGVATMASDAGTGAFSAPVTYSASTSVSVSGSDGSKQIRMRYRDQAGNERTDSRTLVLDRVAPTTTSDTQALYTDTATIALAGSDALSGVAATYWRLDGAPAVAYTGPFQVTAEGQHSLQFYSVDRAGNAEEPKEATLVIDRPNVVQPPIEVVRLAGRDRYATAAAVSKSAFRNWSGVTDIVVANGMDAYSADPLSASGLAGAHRAPIILVNNVLYNGKLIGSAETAIAEIKAANGGSVRIHVVGGPVPVPPAVYTRLTALKGPAGTIERVYGNDRYATSVAVAKATIAKRGINNIPGVLIANGQSSSAFHDALAASSSAYASARPLLLTQKDAVPASVSSLLAGQLAGKPRAVVNASGHVSSTVMSKVGASLRMSTTTERKASATQIAEFAATRGWVARAHVGVANTLPDALSGGVALGELGGTMLYTDASQLAPVTGSWLDTYKTEVRYVHIFGGDVVVAPGTLGQIQAAVD